MKEEELEMIHSFDLEIVEKTLFISKTVQEEMDEILSVVFILKQIRDIETLIVERLNFINQHK